MSEDIRKSKTCGDVSENGILGCRDKEKKTKKRKGSYIFPTSTYKRKGSYIFWPINFCDFFQDFLGIHYYCLFMYNLIRKQTTILKHNF